eukprot:CAMPEP_0194729340 /NCGR_PEP_ID=MMETSP0296-20130528/46280_1 /TAXON_ID=39354 /ORGANISM="Heterosigma akashiwo, Strain CCMP2393" /LENGTH=89 /DNA_ID=CAMNT_0039635801 /DNA_START=33 /DNA_END=300 /DNA_ORIENTATION=-
MTDATNTTDATVYGSCSTSSGGVDIAPFLIGLVSAVLFFMGLIGGYFSVKNVENKLKTVFVEPKILCSSNGNNLQQASCQPQQQQELQA